ncbi:hypothetical protein C7460_114103 [Marinoscillum furvescens DSM 4134]|uniref:IPExxxVDY family protein n=2 Tax=Marinoscillum furvescens TaxID=1026 RepID=A0A3D9L2I4_MARFU|nr:hypothetical protein C7460_114103 [Marinoscillum furvescens DSM 4134]
MKKSRLTSDYPIDFELIGIVSSAREYKLAWHINQLEDIHLVKSEDLKIDFADNRQIRASSMTDEGDYYKVCLIKNRLVSSNVVGNQHLVSELQQFDYLLKITNQTKENWAKTLVLDLKQLPVIDYCVQIDVERVKMKDNLLF